jgi:hypothetical protein
MSPSKTAGNEAETESDIVGRLIRMEGQLDAISRCLANVMDHTDTQIHEIRQALQPLIDEPDALPKAVKMLGRKLPAWMGGKHG